ncbi:MAG TPA: AAA family ATPase [Ktedonobacteraceae bacterium]
MQQLSQSPNPYCDYDVVRDFVMFFGRGQEVLTLYDALAKHRSISLVGKQHVGKSSLLKYLGSPALQQRAGYHLPQHLFILTDWRDYLTKTREDFFHRVCEQIVLQCKSAITLQSPASTNGVERFRDLLETIKQNNFHPVLLMDAFDRVTSNPEFDASFFSFLRSLAGLNDLISYVTATKKPLAQVCHSAVADSPFFNIFLTLSLGPLTQTEAQALVSVPAETAGEPFNPQEIDWLLKMGGVHPFFLQVSCRYLFDEKRRGFLTGTALLEKVQRAIYQELLPHFENAWQDLVPDDQQQLTREVYQHVQTRHIHQELSKSLLFCRKVRELSQNDTIELSADDIKNALDHLDDTDFLEESKLSKLQYIVLYNSNGTITAANKRGGLVRELLKKAFEQMKPGDVRNDTALEWRLYNILWYHYFKYRLPNHHTATRLGISLRQFYREQDKALLALRREILAIEEAALQQGE